MESPPATTVGHGRDQPQSNGWGGRSSSGRREEDAGTREPWPRRDGVASAATLVLVHRGKEEFVDMWLVWTGRQRWVRCIVLCLEVEIDSPDMWASNATSLKSPFYLPFILKKEPPPPFVPESLCIIS
jgi:hypothetical protein